MCLFCKIAGHELAAKILFEDSDVVAFADVRPVAPTHVLVIPRQHIGSLDEADSAGGELLGKMLLAAARIAREQELEQGWRLVFNTGANAGQTVPHLHAHVLGGRAMAWPPG